MKQRKPVQTGQPPGRRIAGHAQEDHVIDPYQRQWKPHEPTVCADCRAVFHMGRWTWDSAPAGAVQALCPACHRIKDEYPAGIVTLAGSFLVKHREEILHLARHQEELEKQEHPLNRIMGIQDQADGIEIATTDIHLPRRIGEAVHNAYRGELDFHYEAERYFLRVRWSRDGDES